MHLKKVPSSQPFILIWEIIFQANKNDQINSKVQISPPCVYCVSVQFSGGSISPIGVDKPNNLEADQEDKTFNCFFYIQVNIFKNDSKK
jgi:hypothetical protein